VSRSGYPLEPARVVRGAAEARAKEGLARALRALDRAAEARAAAAARLRAARAERRPVTKGPRSGAEIAREAAFAERLRAREAALVEAVREALAAERRARRAVRRARGALSSAAASREVVERHRARWSEDRDKRRERAEEEARDEVARLFGAR